MRTAKDICGDGAYLLVILVLCTEYAVRKNCANGRVCGKPIDACVACAQHCPGRVRELPEKAAGRRLRFGGVQPSQRAAVAAQKSQNGSFRETRRGGAA